MKRFVISETTEVLTILINFVRNSDIAKILFVVKFEVSCCYFFFHLAILNDIFGVFGVGTGNSAVR